MPSSPHFCFVAGAPRLHMQRQHAPGPAVLYIHGATFPSALSVGYRFADGRSWADDLAEAGYDAWTLDFEGFGGSERPDAFDQAADASPPILRSARAAQQIARAIQHIQTTRGDSAPVAIIAHSWGTIPAALYVTQHRATVSRLVLFGPILTRDPQENDSSCTSGPTPVPAWRLLTVEQQLLRFEEDVPPGAARVLAEPDLARWGPAWLATDPGSATQSPPAVKVPGGPQADLQDIWRGASLYDPARLDCPTLIVRGEWDSLCTDADVARFRAARGPLALADVVIPHATHLMHLESGRFALWGTVNAFLQNKSAASDAAQLRLT